MYCTLDQVSRESSIPASVFGDLRAVTLFGSLRLPSVCHRAVHLQLLSASRSLFFSPISYQGSLCKLPYILIAIAATGHTKCVSAYQQFSES